MQSSFFVDFMDNEYAEASRKVGDREYLMTALEQFLCRMAIVSITFPPVRKQKKNEYILLVIRSR
jgi:hypothetical protein